MGVLNDGLSEASVLREALGTAEACDALPGQGTSRTTGGRWFWVPSRKAATYLSAIATGTGKVPYVYARYLVFCNESSPNSYKVVETTVTADAVRCAILLGSALGF